MRPSPLPRRAPPSGRPFASSRATFRVPIVDCYGTDCDARYALLEFIAHINTEDYDAIPQDFINLGFSPEGEPRHATPRHATPRHATPRAPSAIPDAPRGPTERGAARAPLAGVSAERLKSSGITEGLSFAFRQLSEGGGPKKIAERVQGEFRERYGAELSDAELEKAAQAEMLERMEAQLAAEGVDVKGVTNVMEEMSRRNRELFALPPYVLYVARAFSTLEGIGLSINEDYSIVQECYPYLARRLFTDRSPRAEAALRAMLGLGAKPAPATGTDAGTGGQLVGVVVPTRAPSGALSPAKLIEMSDNFASSSAAMADVDADGAGQAEAAKELANLLLDPKGSTLQVTGARASMRPHSRQHASTSAPARVDRHARMRVYIRMRMRMHMHVRRTSSWMRP